MTLAHKLCLRSSSVTQQASRRPLVAKLHEIFIVYGWKSSGMELNFVFRSQILISEYTLEFRFKKGGRDRKRAKDSQNGFERSRGSVYHEILRRISNSSRFQATGGDRFRGKHREWTNRISGNGPFFGRWNLTFYKINEFIIIFLLLMAFTKRAQIPFSTWLPIAPTPVSLVTAGIYLC